MTKQAMEQALLERTTDIAHAILMRLAETPPGSMPPVGTCVVMNSSGQSRVVLIPQMQHRVEILMDQAKQADVVAFGLVYDGLVSFQCPSCWPADGAVGAGCDKCRDMDKSKVDAIMTIIRTKWGLRISKSLGYGYDDKGHFKLRHEADFDMSTALSLSDVYDVIFTTTPVITH